MRDKVFTTVNPATGKALERFPAFEPGDIDRALERADRQASAWAGRPIAERAALLQAVADVLGLYRDDLALRITAEMGKLIGEARAEIEKCAWVCRFYAEQADRFLADEFAPSEARESYVICQPLGAVLAVMPWNFPFWQVFRFAAPAIAAGNVAVLKHASNVMGCAKAIEWVFDRAGAPEGLFVNLPIRSSQVAGVIADPRIRAVTLTGSDAAGRAVAAAAGKALKKSVLELGGSDPFIVLDDAELDRTTEKAITSRFMNAGQSCIAAKRFIVLESVAESFLQRLRAGVEKLTPGDPLDPDTRLAPLARADLRDELHAQVEDALARGATRVCGGQPVDGPGYYYQPTILTDLDPRMRVYHEELFGPVASLWVVGDDDQAVALANATEFGLGGSVWSRDRERGLAVARRLECGCAFVNELVKSDPRLPFGGVKVSGYGRELARQGIREFVNIKSIWVD